MTSKFLGGIILAAILAIIALESAAYIPHSRVRSRDGFAGLLALSLEENAQEEIAVSIMPLRPREGAQSSSAESGLEKVSSDFVSAWLKAFQGKLGPLKEVFPDNKAAWSSPVSKTLEEMKEQFINFSDFFKDPALTVYDRQINTEKNEIVLDYQLSFWYPLPWRPRIIVPGKATITVNAEGNRVLSVKDDWEVSVLNIMTKQAAPRLWDVWHIFSTPTPEYPPIKTFGRVDRKVTLVELPPTIAVETSWTGLAKFPGPPLLVMPGFALDGELRTSRPNRDPFLTTLPVESSSDSFAKEDGTAMKKNTFTMHVPTQLHSKVMGEIRQTEPTVMKTEAQILLENGETEGQDDETYESDAQVGISDEKLSKLENISIMKSVTGGVQRGDYDANDELVREFAASESLSRKYKALPRRLMAQVKVTGEVTPEKVKEAVDMIKTAVSTPSMQDMLPAAPAGKKYSLQLRSDGSANPLVGFQMFGSKACFNPRGQPAMAIYEIQYDKRVTNVQIELKLV